ncbi:MAG: hypothetical protein KDB01_26165 [Planctomycetaceae bacterium]|nr:hypothetical protein [Planctomycetaceae bacterium]
MIRFAARGDTIQTTRPLGDMKTSLSVELPSGETDTAASACAAANEMILRGRWRVSRCGRCRKPVEECDCE